MPLRVLPLDASIRPARPDEDVCLQLKLAEEVDHRDGKHMLERIVAMLVKLARSFEDR